MSLAIENFNEGVVMFSGDPCAYCVRARGLLERKQVSFREIKVTNNPALRLEMEQLSQRRTIPQIFIHGQSIGGYDDLAVLDRSGELDRLLAHNSTA